MTNSNVVRDYFKSGFYLEYFGIFLGLIRDKSNAGLCKELFSLSTFSFQTKIEDKELALGLPGFEVSRFRGSEVSSFRGFEVSRFRGSQVPRFRGSEVSR